jgi:CRP/FNR family transcriptional regulator, nitrogen fixation regulation protein
VLTQAAIDIESSRPIISMHRVPPSQARAVDGLAKGNPLVEAIRMMGATMSFPSETEIFGEGEEADYAYQVVSGVVRTSKILSDGRRQVGGFYLPGDIFGLEFRDEHTFSAEAITDTKVIVVKRSVLMVVAGRDTEVSRELLALTGRELRRVQDRVLLLVKSAEQRVAHFLLEMAERARGARGGNVVELPMVRRDIADYLGLTVETVSRTLSSLANAAAIELSTSRRIVLRNRSALQVLNA